jgi:hypothetical protein
VRSFEICGWLWCAVAMNSNHKKSGYPLEESCHQPLHLQRYTKLLPLLQQQHSPPSHNGNTTIPNLSLTTSVTPATSNLTEDDLSYLSYRVQYLMEVDRLAYSFLPQSNPTRNYMGNHLRTPLRILSSFLILYSTTTKLKVHCIKS